MCRVWWSICESSRGSQRIITDIPRQDMARANPDRQKEMAKKLEQGKFSIRDWREQLSSIMSM